MKNKLTVNMITKMAIFAALTVIFRRFLTITIFASTKIGLGYLPTIMAGILYGPLAGGITGGVADVVGMLIKPDGVFHPGFTLSSILIGAIPGFISYNIFKRNFKINYGYLKVEDNYYDICYFIRVIFIYRGDCFSWNIFQN